MRRNVNQNERGNVAESKRPARSVFSKYVDTAKKVGRYAALPVLLTLAGCAGKSTEVKSAKATTSQETGYGEMKKGIVKKEPKNLVVSEVETEEKNCEDLGFWCSAENFWKSAVGGIVRVATEMPELAAADVKMNKELAECKEDKCEISVKKDSNLIRVDVNNEYVDYIELKVAKVDDKGIYLEFNMSALDIPGETGPAYYRVNFDGGVVAISKDGSESSNEDVDYSFYMMMSSMTRAQKTEAKPGKDGEAILILHMKGYGEMEKRSEIFESLDIFGDTESDSKGAVLKIKENATVTAINEDIENCKEEKCTLSVKKGDDILVIDSKDEQSAFAGLWVSDMDSSGITLGIYYEVFMADNLKGYLRFNYDGTVETVSIFDGKTSEKNAADAKQLIMDVFGFATLEAKDGKLVIQFKGAEELAKKMLFM